MNVSIFFMVIVIALEFYDKSTAAPSNNPIVRMFKAMGCCDNNGTNDNAIKKIKCERSISIARQSADAEFMTESIRGAIEHCKLSNTPRKKTLGELFEKE